MPDRGALPVIDIQNVNIDGTSSELLMARGVPLMSHRKDYKGNVAFLLQRDEEGKLKPRHVIISPPDNALPLLYSRNDKGFWQLGESNPENPLLKAVKKVQDERGILN